MGPPQLEEALVLRPLAGDPGTLEVSWNLTMHWSPEAADYCPDRPGDLCHLDVFPAELLEVLEQSGATGLKLRLTAGVWDGHRWGVSPFHSLHGPDGALVEATFPTQPPTPPNKRAREAQHRAWLRLRQGLGSLTSSSLDPRPAYSPAEGLLKVLGRPPRASGGSGGSGAGRGQGPHRQGAGLKFELFLPRERPSKHQPAIPSLSGAHRALGH